MSDWYLGFVEPFSQVSFRPTSRSPLACRFTSICTRICVQEWCHPISLEGESTQCKGFSQELQARNLRLIPQMVILTWYIHIDICIIYIYVYSLPIDLLNWCRISSMQKNVSSSPCHPTESWSWRVFDQGQRTEMSRWTEVQGGHGGGRIVEGLSSRELLVTHPTLG